MSEIKLFEGIRMYYNNDEILVNLKDVCVGLGFTRTAVSGNETVRWDRVNKYLAEFGIPTSGHEDTMISEPMFYLLAMKANNQKAKEFQKNVAVNIIPNFRKSLYKKEVLKVPENFREALLLAAEQQLVIEQQQTIIKKLEPRSLYFDHMITTDGLVSMQEVAKLLNIKDMGRTKLYQELRKGNVIMKNSTVPYQHFVNKGYFELKEEIVIIKGGIRKVNVVTWTTQKGLAFIFKFFGLTENKNN